jgi:hypothetical protein
MHAVAILQKIVRSVSAQLDVRNERNLLSAVQALVRGRRLTLMELARHWPGAERIRAPLKRLDRLLGNRDVQACRSVLYGVAAKWVLRSATPTVVVDWSQLKADGRWHLLRAAVAVGGRTITVYEEVHPEATKNNSAVEVAFLGRLHALLPPAVRPVVVTDAGFRGPWFRASLRACSFGAAQLAEANPLRCRLVLTRRPKRGRVELTHYGARARNARSLAMAARAKEPWLLAVSSSLNHLPAAAIVKLYAQRMQIEQSFRDLKSHRYGCAFEDTLTRQARRLEMLLLIHMLASLAAWLVGLAAAANVLARVCAPSLRKRYSVLWIGWACLRAGFTVAAGPPTCPSRSPQLLALAP